jgi:hypothetical protein
MVTAACHEFLLFVVLPSKSPMWDCGGTGVVALAVLE